MWDDLAALGVVRLSAVHDTDARVRYDYGAHASLDGAAEDDAAWRVEVRMRARSVIAILLASLCGCGAEEESAADPSPTEPVTEAPPPTEEVTAYEIHEWGLVDVDLSSRVVEVAAGPGHVQPVAAPTPPARPPAPQNIGAPRKPVLYFHLRDANPDFRFDVAVDLGAARVVEHWPSGDLGEHSVRWQSVGLSREHCEGGPYPTASDPVCAAVADGYCEASELAAYVTDDAGCLDLGGARQSMLFYRGDGPMPALPVTIERSPDGTVQLTNATVRAHGGTVLRLRRLPGGGIGVGQVAMPLRGASVAIPISTAPATDAHRESVRAELRARGLTPSEALAFERAWFGELFDGAAPTPHAFADAVLFFLPEGGADAYARITATPPPAVVRRAMAIRAGWPE